MILNDLSKGDYSWAFTTFAELCDDYITQAKTGEPYDIDHLPKDPFALLFFLVVALVIGFVIALIATGIMRLKLKSVYSQTEADDYVKKRKVQARRAVHAAPEAPLHISHLPVKSMEAPQENSEAY